MAKFGLKPGHKNDFIKQEITFNPISVTGDDGVEWSLSYSNNSHRFMLSKDGECIFSSHSKRDCLFRAVEKGVDFSLVVNE